jgi:hypothetical protein
MNLLEVAGEIARRLATTFTKDESGRRPVFGGIEKFQTDADWHDLLMFHEYFHGDNGAGIGASHQTGGPERLPCCSSRRRDPDFGGREVRHGRRVREPKCACRTGRPCTRSTPPSGSSGWVGTAAAR